MFTPIGDSDCYPLVRQIPRSEPLRWEQRTLCSSVNIPQNERGKLGHLAGIFFKFFLTFIYF